MAHLPERDAGLGANGGHQVNIDLAHRDALDPGFYDA